MRWLTARPALLLEELAHFLEEIKSRAPLFEKRVALSERQATPRPSRQLIRSMRGKYRGEGLMDDLMEEKKREREL